LRQFVSDLLVFGRRAGLAAAEQRKQTSSPIWMRHRSAAGESEALSAFQRQWREFLTRCIAICRVMQSWWDFPDTEDMERRCELAKLKERAAHYQHRRLADVQSRVAHGYRTESMLTVSEAVTRSALVREEAAEHTAGLISRS